MRLGRSAQRAAEMAEPVEEARQVAPVEDVAEGGTRHVSAGGKGLVRKMLPSRLLTEPLG